MKTITLEEAFRKGIVKIGDYIDYQPTVATCTLDPSQTGWEDKQTFFTKPLGWQLDRFDGKLILLADKPTNRKLTLKGKKGYENGVEAQHELCRKLYTNSSLASEVISITRDIQETTNLVLKGICYWLASSYAYTVGDIAGFGVRGVNCGCVHSISLWSYYYGSSSNSLGVRPVVCLKSNIQVADLDQQKGGDEGHPWKVVSNVSDNSEEERKDTHSRRRKNA